MIADEREENIFHPDLTFHDDKYFHRNEMHLKGRGTFDFNSVAYKGPRPPLLPQNK
jgi:hypothetical protein